MELSVEVQRLMNWTIGPYEWRPFILVNEGSEYLEIVGRDGRVRYAGLTLSGTILSLQVGDHVRIVARDGKRYRKFTLLMHRRRPALQFGEIFGPPRQYWYLDHLPFVPGVTYAGRIRRAHLLTGMDPSCLRPTGVTQCGIYRMPDRAIKVVVPVATNRIPQILARANDRLARREGRGPGPVPCPPVAVEASARSTAFSRTMRA